MASRSPATQLTTESLPPPPVVSKTHETPATAVDTPNGSRKNGQRTILQQFGHWKSKEPKECKSSQDLLHSSIVTMAVTGVARKSLLPSSLEAPISAIWTSSCNTGASIVVEFGVSIQSLVINFQGKD